VDLSVSGRKLNLYNDSWELLLHLDDSPKFTSREIMDQILALKF
jgi:hypothetical protein